MKKLQFLFFILPPKLYLKLAFWLFHRKFLNLRNPATLNEKIQSLKLNNFQAFHTVIADKLAVRDYIKEKIGSGYLIDLFAYYKDPYEINFSNLPTAFVLKSNHGSAQVKVVRDKCSESEVELISTCASWLMQNHAHYTYEKQYKDIKPCIVIEKLLLNEEGNLPEDYKFHCFNGKVEFIHVDSDRMYRHTRTFYDKSWNKLPFNWSPYKKGLPKYPLGKGVSAPYNLKKMILIAEKLAAVFPYCRIDLYNVKNKIYFGEITLHHESGWARFSPLIYDLIYGEKLKYPY